MCVKLDGIKLEVKQSKPSGVLLPEAMASNPSKHSTHEDLSTDMIICNKSYDETPFRSWAHSQ